MLDLTKRLATVRRASELFRKTPGRAGFLLSISPDAVSDVAVVGDLHGHVDVLVRVLKLCALDSNPRRHLIVQELAHDTRVNADEGDIDRSHRLIDLVCALKCQYPDRVHYLMGNHELSEYTGRSISKNGFALNGLFFRGIEADAGEQAPAFAAAYRELFCALPIAIRLPNRVLVCHTLPDGRDLGLDRFDPAELMQEPWSEESLKRGGTIYAMTWGRDTSPETADRFASLMDADLFVTGHQPCELGFRQANHRQIILDGTEPNPSFCLFSAVMPMTIEGLLAGCRRVAVA